MNFSALLDAWLAETGSRVKRSPLAPYERAWGAASARRWARWTRNR